MNFRPRRYLGWLVHRAVGQQRVHNYSKRVSCMATERETRAWLSLVDLSHRVPPVSHTPPIFGLPSGIPSCCATPPLIVRVLAVSDQTALPLPTVRRNGPRHDEIVPRPRQYGLGPMLCLCSANCPVLAWSQPAIQRPGSAGLEAPSHGHLPFVVGTVRRLYVSL